MSSWLDSLITGIKLVFAAGVEQPARAGINFIGATVVDNESENRIDVTVGAALELSDAIPQPLGSASAGVAATASRSDHAHAHGVQAGGTTHAVATGASAGFQSAADKTAHDANTTEIGAATSAATANTIARRGALGATAFGALTAPSLSPDNDSFMAISRPSAGVDQVEFDGGNNVQILNQDAPIGITAAALALEASGSVAVSAGSSYTASAVTNADISAGVNVSIYADTGNVSIQAPDGSTLISSSFAANQYGVAIGDGAVAPTSDLGGAIQLSTATPTSNPADVDKAWLWYDGANGIDTRASSGDRCAVFANGFAADDYVSAGVAMYTPRIESAVLVSPSVTFSHTGGGSGGKFIFERGSTPFCQLYGDGTNTTLEGLQGRIDIRPLAGSTCRIQEMGASSYCEIDDQGGVCVVNLSSATASLIKATNLGFRGEGYIQFESPNGSARGTLWSGGGAGGNRNEWFAGAAADTISTTGAHLFGFLGTGGQRKLEHRFAQDTTTNATIKTIFTSPNMTNNTSVGLLVVVVATNADGTVSGQYLAFAGFKCSAGVTTQEGATVPLGSTNALYSITIDAAGGVPNWRVRVTGAAATNLRWEVHPIVVYGGGYT